MHSESHVHYMLYIMCLCFFGLFRPLGRLFHFRKTVTIIHTVFLNGQPRCCCCNYFFCLFAAHLAAWNWGRSADDDQVCAIQLSIKCTHITRVSILSRAGFGYIVIAITFVSVCAVTHEWRRSSGDVEICVRCEMRILGVKAKTNLN